MDDLTYKEKMEKEGWHNVYNEKPAELGIVCQILCVYFLHIICTYNS